ncbi:Rrf2 family transcriptional regulator [Croceicoccus sp. Ery15]|uniref:RrF2 family transcriptional regulator n=1 Tax=Croceicoccus sp. Ery15 TaxID=1703338 RepID=UPI00351D3C93
MYTRHANRCKPDASNGDFTIKLTLHTDYALRILMQAAANPGVRLSIADVAERHGISRNHLMKVVNQLATMGLVDTVRGRGGGFWLAEDPGSITLGDVVRQTEPGMQAADCGNCVLKRGCGLTPILGDAMDAFLAVLDRTTLADAVERNARSFFAPDANAPVKEPLSEA